MLKFPSQLVLTESFFGFWRALFLCKGQGEPGPEHWQCGGGGRGGGDAVGVVKMVEERDIGVDVWERCSRETREIVEGE